MHNTSIFLQTFNGSNTTIPVWFMRQAGRYLPQYRKIKEKYSLQEMFTTPEVAAEITCLPIDILKVDAAILFADILTLPSAMGFEITFDSQGPKIKNPINPKNLEEIHDFGNLDYISETIKLTNQRLPLHIPLIGFAGSPFTVLCYLIEGGSSVLFSKTLRLMMEEENTFHQLMQHLTENTIKYLHLQQAAGIKAYQIFDSWGGILGAVEYKEFVLPYVDKIFKEVKLPSIYFIKNGGHLLELIDQTQVDFLSVDHTVDLENNPVLRKSKKGIQGNFFHALVYASDWAIERALENLLQSASLYPRYIFNLSHGVLPNTPVEKLQFITKKVHQFPWPKR